MEHGNVQQLANALRSRIGTVIVGKEAVIDLLLIALFARGHVLLEDVPGTGKTLLAKSLAASLDCQCTRVQCTPDLLPSDLSGIHFYNQAQGQFVFRAGPVFTNILLADEINRATPRTQSSLLEAMEERQVTIDGETHVLPQPFLVLATENPVESLGTFPLPEAQLDRFLLRVSMGYPSTSEGIHILSRFAQGNPLDTLTPIAHTEDVLAAMQACTQMYVSEDVMRYIVEIAEKTRAHAEIALGVSPRGTQALLRAAQARAAIVGRTFVTPDDVQTLVIPVLAHRLVLTYSPTGERRADDVLSRIVRDVPVPSESVAQMAKTE